MFDRIEALVQLLDLNYGTEFRMTNRDTISALSETVYVIHTDKGHTFMNETEIKEYLGKRLVHRV